MVGLQKGEDGAGWPSVYYYLQSKCMSVWHVKLTETNSYNSQPDLGLYILELRGAVAEWLERLSYVAESRRKVARLRLGFAMRRLDNFLCQPSSKWVPFSN